MSFLQSVRLADTVPVNVVMVLTGDAFKVVALVGILLGLSGNCTQLYKFKKDNDKTLHVATCVFIFWTLMVDLFALLGFKFGDVCDPTGRVFGLTGGFARVTLYFFLIRKVEAVYHLDKRDHKKQFNLAYVIMALEIACYVVFTITMTSVPYDDHSGLKACKVSYNFWIAVIAGLFDSALSLLCLKLFITPLRSILASRESEFALPDQQEDLRIRWVIRRNFWICVVCLGVSLLVHGMSTILILLTDNWAVQLCSISFVEIDHCTSMICMIISTKESWEPGHWVIRSQIDIHLKNNSSHNGRNLGGTTELQNKSAVVSEV
eukprot:TRINITY_DN41050_c0_g1_i1.p1 TRINITY_DN41050_c0_g1~~TRINITY_DN41050_c0_g1_i1.p1  ORF type:complete len:320 (-),score=61.72 TRINITY_DN41050_c0_g1_i1:35-994(-)